MRNLKRVLSLAMASVMLLGMMVIGAGAADYTDEASISQKEAAQVLEAIGVMQGNDKGEFLPTADLTREAAAKIITYLLLGKSTADGLTAAKAPFNDVEAGRWSAGSIAYCVSQGIISGDGKGNFFPTATVTGTQFAKMLLCALGYNAETEKYVGPGYELNIAKQVVLLKLNSGVSSSLSANLTREEAARMALNVLNQNLVEYVGGINVTLEGGTVNSGGTRQNVANNALFRTIYQPSLSYASGTVGVYGRPSHKWAVGKTAIGTYGDSAAQTYTAAATADTIISDLAGYTRDTRAELVVNGVSQGTFDASVTNDLKNLTGAGRQVEFYTTKVNATSGATAYYFISKVVVIDTVLAKINSINTVTNEIMYSVVSVPASTYVPGTTIDNTVQTIKKSDNNSNYAKLAEMKADDYVLVTFSNNKLASVATPESVTGAFTSYTSSTGKRTIGGTTYDSTYGAVAKLDADMSVGNDYVTYLDTYGNVIYATADVTATAKTGYVLEAERTGNVSIDGDFTYNVRMLFTDGTQQWVKLASINDENAKSNNSAFITAFGNSSGNAITGRFATYTVRADGSYALKTVANAGSLTNTITPDADKAVVYSFSGETVTKDKVNFFKNNTDVMGSGNTIFLVAVGDGTYRAYNGIKTIPGWGDGGLNTVSGKVVITKNTRAASLVFIDAGAVQVSNDYVFILSSDYDVSSINGDTIYTYKAVVDGKVGTIQSTKRFDSAGTAAVNALGLGFYKVANYSGDYISSLDKVTNGTSTNKYASYIGVFGATSDPKAVIEYISGTISTYGTGAASYVTTSDVAVIAVNADTGSAATLSVAGDMNFYKNVQGYSLVMDRDGFVSTVVFTYKVV